VPRRPSCSRRQKRRWISTAALFAAACATLLVSLLALPAPTVRPAAELRDWFGSLAPAARALVAAAAGFAIAWIAWQLRHPSIGLDSSIYHYAEVAGWVHNGHPGSILPLSYDLPYGNYPVTDEVAQTWAAGISRSFMPLALWNPAMFIVLAVATWQTVRNLEVPRAAAGLATAAIICLPLVVHQLNEPQTDLPAMTWLACTAALATGARRTPALLVPSVVAAGLAVGTKTTPAVMVLAALAVGFALVARADLRALRRPLLLALAGAVVVGGIWYVRNLVQHGSPLWPFTAAPWGDPVPPFLRLVNATLLQHPLGTVRANEHGYLDGLAGGIVLLVGVPVLLIGGGVGLRFPRRLRHSLVLAAGIAAVGFLTFAIAPGTGPQRPGFWFGPLATLRYILPTLGAATVAVALASRAPGTIGMVATLALAGSLVWSLVQDAQLGFPSVPSARTPLAGAAAGVAVYAGCALALTWLRRRRPRRRGPVVPAVPRVPAVAGAPAAALLAGGAIIVGLALAPVSDGFVKRNAGVSGSTALGRDVVAWFAAQPGFDSSHQTIAFVSRAVIAPLAGDHFTHPLKLIPADASCAQVGALTRGDSVVVTQPDFLHDFIGIWPYATAGCFARMRPAYQDSTFSVYR